MKHPMHLEPIPADGVLAGLLTGQLRVPRRCACHGLLAQAHAVIRLDLQRQDGVHPLYVPVQEQDLLLGDP